MARKLASIVEIESCEADEITRIAEEQGCSRPAAMMERAVTRPSEKDWWRPWVKESPKEPEVARAPLRDRTGDELALEGMVDKINWKLAFGDGLSPIEAWRISRRLKDMWKKCPRYHGTDFELGQFVSAKQELFGQVFLWSVKILIICLIPFLVFCIFGFIGSGVLKLFK